LKRDNIWWNDDSWKDAINNENIKGLKPFILKSVDQSGLSCCICPWTKRCSGCIILPDPEERVEDIFKKCHLAVEWHS